MDAKNDRKLIIKSTAKIYPKRDYLVVVDDGEFIIGYRYFREVYVSVANSVPLRYLYNLARRKKVFLIDKDGYIVGEIKIG